MRQSRLMSLVEAVANVVVGYARRGARRRSLVFPLFGLEATLRQNLGDRRDLHPGLARAELSAAASLRGGAEVDVLLVAATLR